MVDESTLKHHDVVPNGQLKMHIWNSWLTLIQSCVAGQVSKVSEVICLNINQTFYDIY